MRLTAAFCFAITAVALAFTPAPTPTDQRPHFTIPLTPPGRDLPVVREYTYRMAGRIRVLLLWVGRDDVGSAVIKWREAGDAKAVELIIGADPQRAPGQLNKWGYLVEDTRLGTTSVVGLISQEKDDKLSDVKAGLKASAEQRAFDTVRGAVGSGHGYARVGTLHAASALTYREADTVLRDVLGDSSLTVKQVERRPGVRAGFISVLSELMAATIARADGRRLAYIHGDKVYELRLLESTRLPRFERDGRTFTDVMRARFETAEAGTRNGTRFELVYGASGPLAGIPLVISYQPKWWLQVDLVFDS
jgi:hypothetical protein